METQLQELIDKIKSEGVKSAEEKAEQITKEAEKRAEEIINNAQKKADSILADAKKGAEQFEQTGKENLTQAGRDLLLTLEKEITSLFDQVIHQQVEESLSQSSLNDIIVAIVKNWNEDNVGDIAILLSEDDYNKLEKQLTSKLAEEMKKGVELKPFKRVKSGFHIAEKDGSAYYDFSSKGVAENLSELLNPALKKILNDAREKEK